MSRFSRLFLSRFSEVRDSEKLVFSLFLWSKKRKKQ